MNIEQAAEQALLWAYYNPNQMIGIATTQHVRSEYVRQLLQSLHESVPDWIAPKLERTIPGQIAFQNGSKIHMLSTAMAFKGRKFDLIFMDYNVEDDIKKEALLQQSIHAKITAYHP